MKRTLVVAALMGLAVGGCERSTVSKVGAPTPGSGGGVPAVRAVAGVVPPAAGTAYAAPLKMLSDTEYPDCPDIGFRSDAYNTINYSEIKLTAKGGMAFDVELLDAKDAGHKIVVHDLDLTEQVASTPEWVKRDSYLTLIGIVNQEWNRHQVGLKPEAPRVQVSAAAWETKNVSRVDIANNCLRAGCWEVILFCKEKGEDVPYYHGWFTFPPELYARLFEVKNGLAYADYREFLEDFREPAPPRAVDLGVLRREMRSQAATFVSKNDELYPVKSDRLKKERNIIQPAQRPPAINAFLTDDTQFATFAPPGVYERKSPRKTTLGKLAVVKSVDWKQTADATPAGGESAELHVSFENKAGDVKTRLVIGGIKLDRLPALDPADAHKGWNAPMGIAVHPFSESYEESVKAPDLQSLYFAMFLNERGEWVDSHGLGMDGPLMFLDKADASKLHLYLLSFERHAFVGHFVIDMPRAAVAAK